MTSVSVLKRRRGIKIVILNQKRSQLWTGEKKILDQKSNIVHFLWNRFPVFSFFLIKFRQIERTNYRFCGYAQFHGHSIPWIIDGMKEAFVLNLYIMHILRTIVVYSKLGEEGVIGVRERALPGDPPRLFSSP